MTSEKSEAVSIFCHRNSKHPLLFLLFILCLFQREYTRFSFFLPSVFRYFFPLVRLTWLGNGRKDERKDRFYHKESI